MKLKKSVKIIFVSVLCGFMISFVLLVATALVMQIIDVNDRICILISGGILTVGSFFSGFSGGFFSRKKGMITGGVCGFLNCLVWLFINIVSGALSGNVFLRVMICILSGASGGSMGVNKRIHEGPLSSLKRIIRM